MLTPGDHQNLEQTYFLFKRSLWAWHAFYGTIIIALLGICGYSLALKAGADAATGYAAKRGLDRQIDALEENLKRANADGDAIHNLRASLETVDLKAKVDALDTKMTAGQSASTTQAQSINALSTRLDNVANTYVRYGNKLRIIAVGDGRTDNHINASGRDNLVVHTAQSGNPWSEFYFVPW